MDDYNLTPEEYEILEGVYQCDNHPPYAIKHTDPDYKVALDLEQKGLVTTHYIGMGMDIVYTTDLGDSLFTTPAS